MGTVHLTYCFSVSSSWPSRKAVFGVWPMARNMPEAGRSCVLSSVVLRRRTAVTPCFRVAQHFVDAVVPNQLDLRILECPLGHDLRRPQFVAAMDHVDAAGEFRQIGGFFDGRIAAADDHQRLVAKPRQRSVANGARGDAPILVGVFRRQAQIVRPRAGGDDHALGFDRLAAQRS